MSKRNVTGARSKLLHPLRLTAALGMLLAACSVQPPAQPPDTAGLETEARTQAESGSAAGAAALYERLASSAPSGARSGYLINAARAHIAARELTAARRALATAATTATAREQADITALEAELTLEQGDPNGAVAMLATITDKGDVTLMTEIARVRGRALFALGRYEEAVRVLADREVWLDNGPDILANQALIWNGLADYAGGEPPAPTGDPTVDGWLALAPIAAAQNDAGTLKKELIEWRARFPDHPAAGAYLADLLATRRGSDSFPSQIALLLPLSSAQQAAAAAIRDGFITAYLRDARRDAQVRVYDTALLGSSEAYLRAQLEGADFVVGPLLRPEVEQVAEQVGFVPTLALNFLPDATSAGPTFFQFALSPEDEAREIARHATARGARRALALVPSNELGRRLLTSFRTEFEALGGTLLAVANYDPDARDFSSPITSLLNLSGSTQRYRRLAANLGMPLQFEPRRRADVDMLFVAANPTTGRLIAPQLRFFYAGDIPTYATSEVYDPTSAGNDNDLNGLYFADVPWLIAANSEEMRLKQTMSNYWPQRSQWVRLFGMGFDAYDLIPMLFRRAPALTIAGVSGELEMDPAQQIHRRLPLAQFRDGSPVAIEKSPEERLLELARRE